MTTYRSRHQPRNQITIAGKVQDGERYDRFYDIAYDAMLRGLFPSMRLPAGQLLLRYVDGKLSIEQARAIPPGSSMNGNNRFSGPRLDGRNGQGALYVATVAGLLREQTHYALQPKPASKLQAPAGRLWQAGQPDQTAAFMQQQKAGAGPVGSNRFHLFRLKHPLQFADLRLTALAPFFHRLQASGEARSHYGIVDWMPFNMLVSAASESQDYSAARGMADAVFDLRHTTGNAGVCAFSSRADSDSGLVYSSHGDHTGGLVFAIMDHDGTPVAALEPAAAPGQAGAATYDTFGAIAAAAY